jgi:cellulose 1,4-beta-cellobiosidase
MPGGSNPFKGRAWYVNPSYRKLLAGSIEKTTGAVRDTLESMQNIPSAFWIDVKSKIYKGQGHDDLSTVEGILEDAAACDPPSLVTLIVYDLPNRDCFALASNGEICCHYGEDQGRTKCDMNPSGPNKGFYREVAGANCADGLAEYRQEYIDPFADVVSQYSDRVPIVLIIEPDSLGNMVTNMADERPNSYRGCHRETQTAYEEGIKYATEKLSAAGATLYVDAAHGGWLGWANPGADKTGKFAKIIANLNIQDNIRGFATNVANYQPVGELVCPVAGTCRGGADRGFAGAEHPCCQDDPCGLESEWNWGHNEVNYVDILDLRMQEAMPGFKPAFIVDTGRNGAPEKREDCSAWCNPRGAGIGSAPTTKTADSRIDAYFWLKTPGESDGCTEELPEGGKCLRFDHDCADPASLGSKVGEPRAPEAGIWFDYQMEELAANAKLGDTSSFQEDRGSCGTVQQ